MAKKLSQQFGIDDLVKRLVAARQPASTSAQIPGLVEPGNIDLNDRPIVHNPDGSISTVRSLTFTNDDGSALLLPSVSPWGTVLSPPEALKLFQDTGQHLGVFHNEDAANAYAQGLHEDQAGQYLAKDQALRAARSPVAPQPSVGGAGGTVTSRSGQQA